MSTHQIIYTSCLRGIDDVQDGQQIFSYSEEFKEKNSEQLKNLFTYTPPTVKSGASLSAETILALPKAFKFTSIGKERYAIAQNTYIGRDYKNTPNSAGNYLSHVIAASTADIKNYPIEFYNSNMLRSHMEFDQVNNPNPPNFLPVQQLTVGSSIKISAVLEFLNEGERLEIYPNILHAVLLYSSTKKRVVICDKSKNIIMWIAAIHYALPLHIALGVDFSTYEYDPDFSPTQICGVLPVRTAYTLDCKERHFVFDFYNGEYPVFEKHQSFYDFLDASMTYDFLNLQKFHTFLSTGYSYNKADTELYASFHLYNILRGKLSSMTLAEITVGLGFDGKYALPLSSNQIVDALLKNHNDLLTTKTEQFIYIIDYILSKGSQYKSHVKKLLVDKILWEYADPNANEIQFEDFCRLVHSTCGKIQVDLAQELMTTENLKVLFLTLGQNCDTWKISFVATIVSSYVKGKNMPTTELSPTSAMGAIYHNLIKTAHGRNFNSGLTISKEILRYFASDWRYLVSISLTIENTLEEIKQPTESMWQYFYNLFVEYNTDNLMFAYGVLEQYKRFDIIHGLYTCALLATTSTAKASEIFTAHYYKYLSSTPLYFKEFGENTVLEYYNHLLAIGDNKSIKEQSELLSIMSSNKLVMPFGEEIVQKLVEDLSIKKLDTNDANSIRICIDYTHTVLNQVITGKLLLLAIGVILETQPLKSGLGMIAALSNNVGGDLSCMTENDAKSYLNWILTTISQICRSASDIEDVYELFIFTPKTASIFFATGTDIYLKKCKKSKDFLPICIYFGLLFVSSDEVIIKEVGKVISKLNKQKLAELDNTIKIVYAKDKPAQLVWEKIKEAAKSYNPIMNFVENLINPRRY